MEISFELYHDTEKLISGNDFRELYNYMIYNGIEYIFDNISYDNDIFDNDMFNVSFCIEFENDYALFLIVNKIS